MKVIEIIIAPDGQARVETRGYSGSECFEASHFLLQALGQQTEKRLTSEFYETTPTQQETRQEQ